MSRAMASSTRSPGAGSPRQWTDSSMALWATVPRAVGGVQAKSSASLGQVVALAAVDGGQGPLPQPEVSPCAGGARRGGAAAPPARRAARARSRGSNSGRSWGRAPRTCEHLPLGRAQATVGVRRLDRLDHDAIGVGFRIGIGVGDQLHPAHGRQRVRRPGDVTPRGVDWTGGAVVLPPLRPSRPGPRGGHARLGLSVPGLPQPAAARRGAAVDQALAGRRHRGGGGAGPARGRPSWPTWWRGWWPPTGCRARRPTSPGRRCGGPSRARPERRRGRRRGRVGDAVLARPAA